MKTAWSRVVGTENHVFLLGASMGLAETGLRELETKVAEQEATVATLERRVLGEREDEKAVALLLDDGEGEGEGTSENVEAVV